MRDTLTPEIIFYDGRCGLCHRFVRFVLTRDQSEAFHFAPLESELFRARVPENNRVALPDSLVLLTTDGTILTRSEAVLHILRRLGGVWRLLASLIGAIPITGRDWLYDQIARIRHRLFRRPQDSCPIVPTHLRDRFDL